MGTNGAVSNRLRILVGIVPEVFTKVFSEKKPLDVVWQQISRKNRNWGSKDRRFYGDTTFALFRWWGWVRLLFPTSWEQWTIDAWKRALFVAASLERLPKEWFEKGGMIGELENTLTIKEKSAVMSELFPWLPFTAEKLLPNDFSELFYGDKGTFAEFIRAQQTRPPIWIRCANELDIEEVLGEMHAKHLEFERFRPMPKAIKLTGRGNIKQLRSYINGKVEIQDLASQVICEVCAPKGSEKWLDFCAGAGGKTLNLAAQMDGKGEVVACDPRTKALEELTKRAKKAGFKNINVVSPKTLKRDSFDGVLVDAPCSNTGTWRRNPALRWQLEKGIVEERAKLQLKILTTAALKVKSGGVLVYSTCSVTSAENEALVERFLDENKKFALDGFTHPITGEKVNGMLPITHDLGDNDSMFVARLRKK